MADIPPFAAVDVGSNTIHLVVARPTEDGLDLITLADELDLTRLGADVSATGAIGPERAARAIAVLRAQAARAQSLGAQELLAIATEGVRAAANADDFLEQVREETGITLRVVTGDQEAALTYWGATSGLPTTAHERLAVLDCGEHERGRLGGGLDAGRDALRAVRRAHVLPQPLAHAALQRGVSHLRAGS